MKAFEIIDLLVSQSILLSLSKDKLAVEAAPGVLTADLVALIRDNKAALMAYLSERQHLAQMSSVREPIKTINRSGQSHWPLSFSQQRLWFIDKLNGSSSHYNMTVALEVIGSFNTAVAEQAFDRIVQRHEILRTRYLDIDGDPVQVIDQRRVFSLTRADLSQLARAQQTQALQTLLTQEAQTPFDLSADLMVRASYINTGFKAGDPAKTHCGVLMFNMHHIASDGWSMGVLVEEFMAQYQSVLSGQGDLMAPLTVQFVDYGHWQREQLQGDKLEQLLGFWQQQLADVPSMHSLVLDYPRPAVQATQGGLVSGQLPAAVNQRLTQLAAAAQVTPFMLFHSVLALLFARHSNSDDIVIGTPMANRLQPELQAMIGFFINVMVLRVNTNQANFGQYLQHVRQVNLDAQAHQDVPFDLLVERLNIERNTAHTPLYQLMFMMNTTQSRELVIDGVKFNSLDIDTVTSRHDLHIGATENRDGSVSFHWTYDKALFSQSHIEQLNDHLMRLLAQIGAQTHTSTQALTQLSLSSLSLHSDAERQYLLQTLNDTTTKPDTADNHEWRPETSLLGLLAAQVAKTPDHCALRYGDTSLSYQAFDEASNRLAHCLIEEDVGAGVLVGICVERSLEMMVALLAVLKAGGTYVPLDPAHPAQRLALILQSSEIELVLTTASVAAVLPVSGIDVMLIEACHRADNAAFGDFDTDAPEGICRQADSVPYVLFTSGSTGVPKGVEVTDAGLLDYLQFGAKAYYLASLSGAYVATSYGFDIGVPSLWLPLLKGGVVELAPHGRELAALSEVLQQDNHSYLLRLTPHHVEGALLGMRELFVGSSAHCFVIGGSVFNIDLAKRLQTVFPQAQIFNHYGPTETVVGCCMYDVSAHLIQLSQLGESQAKSTALPIGRAMDNTQLYVLDQHQQLVPLGAVGELYIGGVGVAKGYVNQPEMTAKAFVTNPFAVNGQSARLYRTGDLVRHLPTGDLLFVGRADALVKIRGFRVELGEIEQQLCRCDEVREAVVMLREDQPGLQQLVAYVVASDESHAESLGDQLKLQLKAVLPAYMQPSAYVVLDTLPLNANGKVDKKALLKPNSGKNAYRAPQTEMEQRLTTLWSALLNLPVEDISSDISFFELGGYSLLGIRLVSEIRRQLQVELPISVIFNASTIETMAAQVSACVGDALRPLITPVSRDATVNHPLSFSQQRLWFINQLQGATPQYNMPIAFKVEGNFNLAAVTEAFTIIIARHEVLRTVFVQASTGSEHGALQQISTDFDFQLAEHDLCDIDDLPAQTAQWRALIASDAQQPFDLSKDLMVRVSYIALQRSSQNSQNAQRGILMFNMHHIASDGWSLAVLTEEFVHCYLAIVNGQAHSLPPLAIQYADYAHWQRQWLPEAVLASQLSYWQQQLAEVPPLHTLPLDYPRPAVQQHVGGSLVGSLDATMAKALQQLAKHYQLTPFMLLHSALALVLSRHSHNHDIVIGTPVANRMQSILEPLIGFFVNTVVLRVDTQYLQLEDYLAHVREVHVAAQSNQDVPFELLVERLNLPRSTAHTPLFQIMLTTNTDYGRGAPQTLNLAHTSLTPLSDEVVTSKFDLEVNIGINEQGVSLYWLYDAALFNQGHISQLNDHLCCLLQAMATLDAGVINAPLALTDLPMLSATEAQHLLTLAQGAQTDYPSACIHQLFEAQALLSPDNIALLSEHEGSLYSVSEVESLSYSQLNHRANQLAHHLIEHYQVKPGAVVALCIERSVTMVVAVLAILKAGAAYAPLEILHDRTLLIKRAALIAPVLVLTSDASDTIFSECKTLNLSEPTVMTTLAQGNCSNPKTASTNQQLGYVLTTSGSTGEPKLIGMNHQPLVNLIYGVIHDCPAIGGEHRLLQFSSIGFDMSYCDITLALFQGGTLSLISQAEQFDVVALSAKILRQRCTLLNLPYAMLQTLASYANQNNIHYPDLTVVLSSAERLLVTPEVRSFFSRHPQVILVNHYGPSETHVCTTKVMSREVDAWPTMPSIGRPLPNTRCYVLTEDLQLAPQGAMGTLYVGGDCLAQGYLGQPVLTAEKFIVDPFDATARLYNTGDLVRLSENGDFEYQGRADNQIKLRGFRIELGAIESVLADCPEVKDNCVIFDQTNQRLVAYISTEKCAVQLDPLRQYLAGELPPYMIPSVFMLVDKWPLNANGKVDKNALPLAQANVGQVDYQAPETNTEKEILKIWEKLLHIEADAISVNENFFALGGHSLLVIRLVALLNEHWHIEVSISAIYDIQTVLGQAILVDEILREQAGVAFKAPRTILPAALGRSDLPLPLSFSQQRLWFIDQLQQGTLEYNLPVAFAVKGQLDLNAVTEAMRAIIERHEVLRTVFIDTQALPNSQDTAAQCVRHEFEFCLGLHDLSALPEALQAAQLRDLIDADEQKPFDLSNDLMVRASYILLNADQNKDQIQGVLLFNMHHIASDGWSMAVLTREFVALYQAIVSGNQCDLPALEIQYSDYALWQRQHLQDEVLAAQLGYWQQQLADLPAVHGVTLDHPRPGVKQHVGAMVTGHLSGEVAAALGQLALHYRLTPFMLFHGALALVLAKHSNSSDIVIGTAVANRMQASLEPLIGFFVNNLVLRVNTRHDLLADYLSHVRTVHLAAQSNQDVPFEQLVECLNIPRTTAHSPLFQILLATNTDYGLSNDSGKNTKNTMNNDSLLELPGVKLSPLPSDNVIAKYDMKIDISLYPDGLDVKWAYDAALFEPAHVAEFNQHLCQLLSAMASVNRSNGANSGIRLNDLPIISGEAQHALLDKLSGRNVGDRSEWCLPQRFAAQVRLTPDNLAVVCAGQSLSYAELGRQVNQLASFLSKELGNEPLVGLFCPRSPQLLVAILAILTSGSAYLPFEPNNSLVRNQQIINGSGVRRVLVDSSMVDKMPTEGVEVIVLDQWLARLTDDQATGDSEFIVATQTQAEDVAYVIYTSGSTGQPKGVEVTHANVMDYCDYALSHYYQAQLNGSLLVTSHGFDISVPAMYLPLLSGDCVTLLVDEYQATDIMTQLTNALVAADEGIAAHYLLRMTPHHVSGLLALLEHQNQHKHTHKEYQGRHVFVIGGEPFATPLAQALQQCFPDSQIYNHYGPTEATVGCSMYDVSFNRYNLPASLPIGRAMDNTQLLVLGEDLQLLPAGVCGELYIGGAGVAKGYLNQPELTAERFMANPYAHDQSGTGRLYRTGDLVRLQSSGELEFVGRVDDQVKIRGFRIELGEIEHQLTQLEPVASALVMAQDLGMEHLQLVAYVQLSVEDSQSHSDDQLALISELKQQLSPLLPHYMMPSALVLIEQWPLSANGKVDKKALPLPDRTLIAGRFVAPQSATERHLTELWATLLNLDASDISVLASFFDLGGHSLLLTRLRSQIIQQYQISLALSQMFKLDNIRLMAQTIDNLLFVKQSKQQPIQVESEGWL